MQSFNPLKDGVHQKCKQYTIYKMKTKSNNEGDIVFWCLFLQKLSELPPFLIISEDEIARFDKGTFHFQPNLQIVSFMYSFFNLYIVTCGKLRMQLISYNLITYKTCYNLSTIDLWFCKMASLYNTLLSFNHSQLIRKN